MKISFEIVVFKAYFSEEIRYLNQNYTGIKKASSRYYTRANRAFVGAIIFYKQSSVYKIYF